MLLRIERFTKGDIQMYRAKGIAHGHINRFIGYPMGMPRFIWDGKFVWEGITGLHMAAINILLPNSLPIPLVDPFCRPVCGYDDQGDLLIECLSHSRTVI